MASKNNNTTVENATAKPDTIKRPFRLIFKDVTPIHAGSSYNVCKVEFLGTNKIALPQALWQDKFAWSDDSKKLVLVKSEARTKNFTSFKFFIIDLETGSTQESISMAGTINSLQLKKDTIFYNKFYYNKIRSKDTICCAIQENYIIKLI